MRPTTEKTLDAAWNIPNLSLFRKTCPRTWNTVCYVTLAVLGGSHVVKPSHLLDLTNPNCELRDRLPCVILLCSVYCAVVHIYYSDVLNKVSSYTVLVELCCDSLQHNKNNSRLLLVFAFPITELSLPGYHPSCISIFPF